MNYRTVLHNSRDSEVVLYFEPWGQDIPIPPKQHLTIEAQEPIEIVFGDDYMLVYGERVLYQELEIYPENNNPNWPHKYFQGSEEQ